MAKLSILGAQRVKALSEMLDEKEKQAIVELKATFQTQEELKKQTDEEFGLEEKTKRVNELEFELRELLVELNQITGQRKEIRVTQQYANNTTTDWYKRYRELENEQKAQIKEVQESYAQKKRQLWLCETLEEAKGIVGI